MSEDFVPFELAKKLQEKGCSVKCLAIYTNVGILHCNESLGPHETYMDLLEMSNNQRSRGFIYDAPAISQVLKWLREEKKVLVVAAPEFLYREARYFWQCGIYRISLLPNVIPFHKFIDNQESYDSAIIAGIEYCLENLI